MWLGWFLQSWQFFRNATSFIISTKWDAPPDGSLICHSHYTNLLLIHSSFYKLCYAPYGPYKKAVTGGWRIVTLKEFDGYSCLGKRIILGRKLCTNCIKKLNVELKEYNERVIKKESSQSSESQSNPLSTSLCQPVSTDTIVEIVDDLCTLVSKANKTIIIQVQRAKFPTQKKVGINCCYNSD